MLNIDRSTKLALLILGLGHSLAAWFSFGYHHPDEHYQILEWAHYFCGLAPDASHLRWEFGAQIRPWFQPLLHAAFIKASLWLNAYNPFDLAFLFRLIYAALNLWSLVALWNHFKGKFQLESKHFLIVSLLWFFPYIHVRTSSENLAGIFLSFALIALSKGLDRGKGFWSAGLLFGFAFLARYQIALGLVGVAAILLMRARSIKKEHFILLAGFLIPVGLGVLLDRWGYGNWVFTPYRYYKVNIVENVAATFNPYPWYQYFIWILQLNPLISLPLFFGWIGFSRKNPLNTWTGFTILFFALHCLITNKEYRFLFPILNFIPFMALGFLKPSMDRLMNQSIFWLMLVLVNAAAFSISSLHGASTRSLWYLHAVNQVLKSHPGFTWLSTRNYKLKDSQGILYYDPRVNPEFEVHKLKIFQSRDELFELLLQNPKSLVFIDGNGDDLTRSYLKILHEHECERITQSYPESLAMRLPIPVQTIYGCK